MPETTEALVHLQEYLRECQDKTVHKLKDEIDEAANRLQFLLDYAIFPCKYHMTTLKSYDYAGMNK